MARSLRMDDCKVTWLVGDGITYLNLGLIPGFFTYGFTPG